MQRTLSQSPCSPACGCNLSHLLKRGIDLIDPPQSPTVDSRSGDGDDGDEDVSSAAPPIYAPAETNVLDAESITPDGMDLSQTPKKKVRFSKSCSPARKVITASDAIQAYNILIHAASIISPPELIGDDRHGTIYVSAATNWETLQHVADIYRALLVTSCLVMELLPPDLSNNNDTTKIPPKYPLSAPSRQSTCPLSDANGPTYIPTLSSAIEKRILSTSRRCILLLQALERMCAAKAFAQRHRSLYIQPIGNNTIIRNFPASYYSGGDDIHDYDRNSTDLCSNYDWHDDGYLPQPFSSNNHGEEVRSAPACNGDIHRNDGNHQSNKTPNILQECCYRPQHPTDPPSSRFEMNAWTRVWIRGERIVSLRLDDYHYYEESGFKQDFEGDFERADAANIYIEAICNLNEPNEVDGCGIQHDPGDDNGHLENDGNDGGSNHEDIVLNMSPKALAEEEDCLLNIMLPCHTTTSDNSQSTDGDSKTHAVPKCSSKKRNAKERRRRKRQRKKSVLHLARPDSTSDGTSQPDQRVHVKEGFILLVCEDYPNTIVNYPDIRDESNLHLSNSPMKLIRVYARLQPSGLLTIEDCSIRRKYCNGDNDVTDQQQPLPPHVRYWDFFIGPKTQCQPFMPEGAESFHFQLYCIHLLGASSLCQTVDTNNETNNEIKQNSFKKGNEFTGSNGAANLLFSVDEEAGGAFVDGFEWVNALSGAANTASAIQEKIHTAWEE